MRIPTNSLDDKVALITGAGSGIGRATAKLMAHCGCRVALLSRTESELEKLADEITRTQDDPERVLVLPADVTDEGAMREAVERIEAKWGRLDILFANAGVNGKWAPIEELSPDDWDRTMQINLKGTFLSIRACVDPMRRAGGGSIVITSSVNGTRMFSNSGASAYAASKAAQLALGRMLAVELADDRIRVNTICPGAIETEIDDNTNRTDIEDLHVPVQFPEGDIPLTGGQPGTAGQVAETVWFLASDASSHTTGAEIFIDGAQSLLVG
ncbi:SDR family oxidoreductase [Synoicihabitans lomoniglobus]|uniref:SDR family NAD(P)-dependent oxidoreductase n=1 Tax=Synoicihabitans lomoniglobus TaxID=2909285 RepID=A0AAF0CP22_9BACT|nr:SDR family oxidoreductase [Opitutaceae bacterium LMO-M01]WED65270.1 SDR family NAD(P)-dependent oxidoreductase [Opitutaceae bacterium LMO-M01]